MQRPGLSLLWTGGCGIAGVALASMASLACSAPTQPDAPRPSAPEQTSLSAAALSGPVTRSQVIANAEQWVAAMLQYCQSPNGQPDPDTSCTPTCQRESNTQWDPYRSDCSGFVSWAWELPPPGLVTSTFAPFDTSESSVIQCADMQPGDAANRDPNTGHIVLFKEWITPGSEAVFLEEPGCSSSTPYAHEFQSAVTCNGTSADIAYEGDTFTAIRYVSIVDDPADAGAGSSGGSGSSSGSSGGSSGGSGSSSGGGSSGGSGGSSGGAGAGSSSGAGAGSSGGAGAGSSGGAGAGSSGGAGAGSSSGAGTGSSSGAGAGSSSGTLGGGTSSGATGAGASPAGSPDGGGFDDLSGGSSSGCDVAPSGRDGAGAWGLAALSLVFMRRRRRSGAR